MSLKLLSFVLSFQKRKYMKEQRLQEIFVLMISACLTLHTPSVIFLRKCHLPLRGRLIQFPRPRRHKSPARKYNNSARSAPLLFTSLFSLNSKIPAGAGIFIAFILPNKRQIRRQSERQHRLQSPKRRYRRARGAYLSGLQPRRICPWAYAPESFRFSESASRLHS